MAYSDAFNNAFERTLGHEGGYVHDPVDPGGETKYGISKRSYPQVDIRTLTVEDAKHIYHRDFWQPLQLDLLRGDVAAEIFDTAINMGKSKAVTIAQRSACYLGHSCAGDGIIGPKTLAALNAANPSDLLRCLNALQLCRYVELVESNPAFAKFAVGWLKRIQVVPT